MLTTPEIWLGFFYAALIFTGWRLHRKPCECQVEQLDNDYEYVETWTWPAWKGSK